MGTCGACQLGSLCRVLHPRLFFLWHSQRGLWLYRCHTRSRMALGGSHMNQIPPILAAAGVSQAQWTEFQNNRNSPDGWTDPPVTMKDVVITYSSTTCCCMSVTLPGDISLHIFCQLPVRNHLLSTDEDLLNLLLLVLGAWESLLARSHAVWSERTRCVHFEARQ